MTSKKEKAVADENVFNKLLELKDTAFRAEVHAEFFDEPIVAYYMPLKKGERDISTPGMPDSPEGFQALTMEERLALVEAAEEEYVFAMIQKAQTQGDVPDKYHMDREQWDNLGEHFAGIRKELVGKITGGTRRLAESFLSGQNNQVTQ